MEVIQEFVWGLGRKEGREEGREGGREGRTSREGSSTEVVEKLV